jgi:hypothetical protein
MGRALVASKIALATDDDDLLKVARRMVESVHRADFEDPFFDVIGGGAGAILALVAMRDAVGEDLCISFAEKLAQQLCNSARRFPSGVAWGGRPPSARPLAGFAHGASGIAIALHEVAAITGNELIKEHGDLAYSYEDDWFDLSELNWPDFRNYELGRVLREDGPEAAVERFRSSQLGGLTRRFMQAWCHGAPGCAMARMRSWQLFGDPHYIQLVRPALHQTQRELQASLGDPCLCHGVSGNARILATAAHLLDEPSWHVTAREALLASARRLMVSLSEDPSTLEPGFMDGHTGLGWACLTFSNPRAWIAPLLATSSTAGRGSTHAAETVTSQYAETYFENTIRVIREVSAALIAPDRKDTSALTGASALVASAKDIIERTAPGVHSRLLSNELAFDLVRVELLRDDESLGYLEAISHEETSSARFETGRWTLSRMVRVLAYQPIETSPQVTNYILAVRRGDSVSRTPLGMLAGSVLFAAASPQSFEDICIAAARDIREELDEGFEGKVRAQLVAAHQRGIIVRAW